mmetsp:Transcript_9450/g.33232  ORF Transcript_9450/g.33232 Transcript_9450/m.33232 type:complete len:81 (-) Transcript_9450:102-344(-)
MIKKPQRLCPAAHPVGTTTTRFAWSGCQESSKIVVSQSCIAAQRGVLEGRDDGRETATIQRHIELCFETVSDLPTSRRRL